MKKPVIILSLLCVVLTGRMQAATINVPADHTSLQAALAAAATGDEIVISTNGPFNEFIALYGSMASNITVRAATGFNPVIEGKAGMTFSPAGTPPDAAIQDGVLAYLEHGSTWIGIKFRIDMAGLDDLFGSAGEKYHCKIGGTFGGSVNFTNCTWEWANDPNDPNALNSHMLRVEAGAALNPIHFDQCHWGYVNMTPTNLGGRLTGAFTDSVGVVNDTTFTDCSWDISPDTGGFRRHGVGVLNATPSTLRFLRCNFGDINATDPSTNSEPRQGQAWCNLPHRIAYFDQCIFGRGAGRVIATAIPGEQYVNRCLFRPTRGNFTLNDPVFGGNTIPTYFTNCVFQYRTTTTGSTPINNFNGNTAMTDGTPGRGSFSFSHCTYVDLDGAAGRTNRGFMSVGTGTEGSVHIENCLFSAPAMEFCGIIKNLSFTPAGTEASPTPGDSPSAATIAVNGTNMLLASSGYNITNDVLQHATGNNIPILANPLLQGDNIHLSAGSPAINAGGNLGVPTDYDGNARPVGPLPDIGADEVSVGGMLTITRSGANVVISWTGGGALQAAPGVTGTYTNISGATSPYTNAITGTQQFFRTSQ